MKKLLILPVLALALAACGQSGPTAPVINVTGNWTGTTTVQGQSSQPSYLKLTQASDGSVTGTLTDQTGMFILPLTGSVSSGKLTATYQAATVVLQGAFTNTTYAGTFVTTKNSDNSVIATGTFSFTKNQ